MAITLNQLPEWSEFQKKGFYADFTVVIDPEPTARALWDVFVDEELTELKDINGFITDDQQELDLSKIFAYKSAGMDYHAKSVFKKNLLYFFGTHLHKTTSTISPRIGITSLSEKFRDYLESSERPDELKARQNIIPVFWAWQLLLEVMKHTQKTTLNKANASVLFALGEENAVNKMGQIEFELQTSDTDYETIKDNMDAQQESENHRNWRSIIGKSTSQYQNDVQTASDSRAQFSQLATKLVQEMESMASAITRIG
ncbi:hypothetical protein [Candidatus Similichlamydia laticola]|uniref:Uncharacterized protein n=1 Tax=Candidatus Similichlamydia laticola TaxID=2170265 RepID=A0A369KDX7_9BACT|nr:hypothetical protein [Candidatus Similichlamydia laticola]RDB31802.1 hypothetical protein HAT2_00089 [Candidatus Similichlamydia laticola]